LKMSASEKESDGITEKGSDQVSELNVYVINCDVNYWKNW